MCGISGFVSEKLSNEDLVVMTERLQHRGPDASGYFYDEKDNIGLGHRRLSILDLSEAANQPFFSRCGRYVMAYNGEVYNFNEIALELSLNTLTTSDTEVIIEAFALKGLEFVNLLNGMFALAIWDKQDQQLYLFRDRLGIKPLYYYLDSEQLIFASEIKSIKQSGLKLAINHDLIAQYLNLGYLPQTETAYKNINKLLPGHYLIYKRGLVEMQAYWQLSDKIKKVKFNNLSEAKEDLKKIIVDSVQHRMISDVPLGTFLSGGIDSSLITAVAQSLSDQPVKTFSIGFKESKFNESHYAKKVADYLQTDHHEYMLSEKEAKDNLEHILEIYDEPFADVSSIPTLMISEEAKKEVSVILSGDGGDEQFMGYGMYQWSERLHNPFIRTFRKPIGAILSQTTSTRNRRAANYFKYLQTKTLKNHIFSQDQNYFSENEINRMLFLKGEFDYSLQEPVNLSNLLSYPEEQQAYFDLMNYLPEDLLVKVDRASMHHGLEVRVPLLDHRLVEFSINLDKRLKLKKGERKYLLKQLLYDYLPFQYFDRPKWGFSIPLIKWLKNDLRYLLDDYLNKAIVEEYNFIQWSTVQDLKQAYFNGEDFIYNRLWLLIVLHKWLKENA